MSAGDRSRILIVDDDPDILTAGRMLLKRRFAEVDTASSPEDIPAALDRRPPDVILLDMNFGPGRSSGEEGLEWLEAVRRHDPEAVVIMITAHGGVSTAVEAMKCGATDFIAKPWQNEKLLATVSAGAELAMSRKEAKAAKGRNRVLAAHSARAEQPMLGASPALMKVQTLIARAAPTDANVLVLGENGTGKELAARALHRASARADEVFLSVDLGAVPESLFDSELFGHKKGAFTDAKADRVGRLEAASGGTLFLDEIGNLPLHLQSKLLTALEQRKVTPVGATRPVAIDVRVVAATNRRAEELADPEIFRQDLLFRLNTVEIDLPPLRERREDVPQLLEHYLRSYERKYDKPERPLAPAAAAALSAYGWPGNVRALRHACERAVILSSGAQYSTEDFSLPATALAAADRAAHAQSAPVSGKDEDLNLERLEKAAIAEALKKHRFNISHAAKELGLTRAALYRRMEKHDL